MKKQRYFLALAFLIFATSAYILGWSTFFTVSSVEIVGTSAVMGSSITVGEKLARVEPRVIAAEFEKFSWIRKADVSRNWLNGKVTITLTERKPVSIYNDRAIDGDGVSFPLPTRGIQALPHIQGATIEAAVAASAFFMQLPTEIANVVRLITVRSGDIYFLEIVEGTKSIEVVWGKNEENALKTDVYKALIARSENSKIFSVDLTAPLAPIVK